MSSIFLTAEWRKLAMANYKVEPSLLHNFLPPKTEIDTWNNACYVSLVGFMFCNTRLKGFRIPGHVNFEEVNLRFYVKYHDGKEWKRGVVFIKEIVPKPALTFVANTVYGEKYETMPMSHEWTETNDGLSVKYAWKKGAWHSLQVQVGNEALPIGVGSEEEFITEHYWGYTKLSKERTAEYAVEHPRWNVYQTKNYDVQVDYAKVYGNEFGFLTAATPDSVFLAEGSEIVVKEGSRI